MKGLPPLPIPAAVSIQLISPASGKSLTTTHLQESQDWSEVSIQLISQRVGRLKQRGLSQVWQAEFPFN